MPDHLTTLADLREAVRKFVAERDWRQFHTPKNLAMSVAIEAAELMEHFQWLTVEESRTLGSDPAHRQAIGEELADVLCYLLSLANEMGLDVSDAVQEKIRKNALKYPVEEFRGRFTRRPPAEM